MTACRVETYSLCGGVLSEVDRGVKPTTNALYSPASNVDKISVPEIFKILKLIFIFLNRYLIYITCGINLRI